MHGGVVALMTIAVAILVALCVLLRRRSEPFRAERPAGKNSPEEKTIQADHSLHEVDSAALSLVPRRVAEQYHLVPLSLTGSVLKIAIADPTNVAAMDEIAFMTGLKVELVPAADSDITSAIRMLYAGVENSGEFELGAAPDEDTREDHTQMPVVLTDQVHFLVAGPAVVTPEMSFVIDVWAHLAEKRESVMKLASAAARAGEHLFFKSKGPVQIARGTVLTARLTIEGLQVQDPEDTILWLGETGNASFPVNVPKDAAAGDHHASVTFHIAGQRVAKMHFVMKVGHTSSIPTTLSAETRLHKTAFASYASSDRDEVLAVVQGIQKGIPGIQIFLDVASLRSGQQWQEALHREIDNRDVLYLFWSRAASQSQWVAAEWRYALAARGPDFIDPAPLASPDAVPPPPELAALHFNDWTLAYKRRRIDLR
jgi:Type II secretion system (T2SS), protein E, N-terminal domain/TIR domain